MNPQICSLKSEYGKMFYGRSFFSGARKNEKPHKNKKGGFHEQS